MLSLIFGSVSAACLSFTSISSLVEEARVQISPAATAKPLPISPALATSILAFRLNRLVLLAIPAMFWLLFTYKSEKSTKSSNSLLISSFSRSARALI